MSHSLKQLAKSSGERRRMLLQSLDTARYQKDRLADTKIDVDHARSEILSAILFGHEIVVPAGVIADCPAAHILLPEVLAYSRSARRWIESDTGVPYSPFRLGLERQFVANDPQGYDAFVQDYIEDERARLVAYIELGKGAPELEQKQRLIELGQAYLGRRWSEVKAINPAMGAYFEFVYEHFAECTHGAPRPVTCPEGTFTSAPQALYHQAVRQGARNIEDRKLGYPTRALRANAVAASNVIRNAGAGLGERGSWYGCAEIFEDNWSFVRAWLDHTLYRRMQQAYSISIPSFFLQECSPDAATRELVLALLDNKSLGNFRAELAAKKPSLPPAAATVDWKKVWELVAEQDVQNQIFKLQRGLGAAHVSAAVAIRRLKALPALEREDERQLILQDYRNLCGANISEHIEFLNSGQTGIRFQQRGTRLMIDVGRRFSPMAGTDADRNIGRMISVGVGATADVLIASPGVFTSGMIAAGETFVGEALGRGVNTVIDRVRRPSNATLKANTHFYAAEQDRVNYWLEPSFTQ